MNESYESHTCCCLGVPSLCYWCNAPFYVPQPSLNTFSSPASIYHPYRNVLSSLPQFSRDVYSSHHSPTPLLCLELWECAKRPESRLLATGASHLGEQLETRLNKNVVPVQGVDTKSSANISANIWLSKSSYISYQKGFELVRWKNVLVQAAFWLQIWICYWCWFKSSVHQTFDKAHSWIKPGNILSLVELWNLKFILTTITTITGITMDGLTE